MRIAQEDWFDFPKYLRGYSFIITNSLHGRKVHPGPDQMLHFWLTSNMGSRSFFVEIGQLLTKGSGSEKVSIKSRENSRVVSNFIQTVEIFGSFNG